MVVGVDSLRVAEVSLFTGGRRPAGFNVAVGADSLCVAEVLFTGGRRPAGFNVVVGADSLCVAEVSLLTGGGTGSDVVVGAGAGSDVVVGAGEVGGRGDSLYKGGMTRRRHRGSG